MPVSQDVDLGFRLLELPDDNSRAGGLVPVAVPRGKSFRAPALAIQDEEREGLRSEPSK